MRIRNVLVLFLGLLLIPILAQPAVNVAPASAAVCRPFPRNGERVFHIVRFDQVLGETRYRFSRDDEAFVVRVDSAYAIGPAAAPLYRFEHHSEEIWRDGRLRALTSDTRENGERWRLRMDWDGYQLSGTVNGTSLAVSGLVVPTSLWHRDTPKSEVLFSVVDGLVRPIRVYSLGSREVSIDDRSFAADGYVLTGAFQRKVWYDEECQLVGAAFLGYDSREVTMELRSIEAP
jgi:hypothetical protein